MSWRDAADISAILFFWGGDLHFTAADVLLVGWLVFQRLHTKMLSLCKVASQTRTGLWALLYQQSVKGVILLEETGRAVFMLQMW